MNRRLVWLWLCHFVPDSLGKSREAGRICLRYHLETRKCGLLLGLLGCIVFLLEA